MTSGIAPRLLGALMAVAVWPAAVLAQGTSAGVVTTLSGQASVVRATADRAPLKFKDDVFLRDKISTGQQSVAKLLLGGKALVTVRELSTLTVTEEAGRSTVDLETGKVAVGVARQRMQPGEVVEIRTPNAIAAVRGTVVVVEVIQASAQATPGPIPVVTNIYVLSGLAEVLLRGIPGATPTTVGPGFGLSVTGNILGTLRPNPPTPQIVGNLRASQQHREPPAQAKEQVAQTQQTRATESVTAAAQVTPGPAIGREVVLVTNPNPNLHDTTVTNPSGEPQSVAAPQSSSNPGVDNSSRAGLPGFTTALSTSAINGTQTGSMFTAAPPFSGFVSWGANAFDLDLHATGPASGGGRFHVFFGNTGSLTAQPFTLLHQDCICRSGSEAITLQQLNQGGVYRFSVFNFGDQATASTNLSSQSGAVFKFVQGGTVVNLTQGSTVSGGTVLTTIAVPTGQAGNTWVVGEYDPATNTFRPTNTITNASGSSAVQLQTPKRRR